MEAELELESELGRIAGKDRHLLGGEDKKACTALLFGMMKVQRGKANAFPGSNPVSIERSAIQQLRQHPYWAGLKTDGQRMLLMAVQHKGRRLSLLIDRAMRFHVQPGELPTAGFEGSLLDGELVLCRDRTWRFLVFDAVYLSGIYLASHPFSVRLTFARAWLADIGAGLRDLPVECKAFAAMGRERLAPSPNMPDDGLVFVPELEAYVPFRSDKLFKWKELHTVDFQVQGNKLMVLNRGKLVERGKLHPSDPVSLGGKIVECKMADGAWRVVKVRYDKTAPNDNYVLGKTVLNIEEAIGRHEFDV